ncbi:ferredoxin [Desulfobacterales bacterium HSG16]|nr:ferredoxin [Desulfobacterales bacterium HSG16]
MADKSRKFSMNISGRYYVEKDCIGCTLCAETAGENFKINSAEELFFEHSYVFKQPDTEEQEALCNEAMENCPASAIGNDGDSE